MPGFDRQLARYPQLYSRIGFAHHYQPLDPEDIPAVLAHYWERIGLPFDHTPGNEAAASAITRITGGTSGYGSLRTPSSVARTRMWC